MLASLAAGGGRGAPAGGAGAGRMRELDAEAPVIWPAWCYSAESGVVGGGERARAVAAAARRCARVQSPHQPPPPAQHPPQQAPSPHAHHALSLAPVKSERLTPPHSLDNRSSVSRSRSATPSTSSYPGTPPERDASPAAPAAPAPARNYSDIMRSLAARYNHAPAVSVSNDLFQPARANGFATSLDARLTLTKAAAAAAAAPGARVSPAGACGADGRDRLVGGLFAGFTATLGLGRAQRVPAFPALLDMSSTKTLLAIARAARSSGAGAGGARRTAAASRRSKRPAGGGGGATEHSPLDLSAGAELAKRARRASDASSASSPRAHTPRHDHDDRRSDTESREGRSGSAAAAEGDAAVAGRGCACGGGGCERLAAWAVDDVCEFVQSIDICAEYAPNFREQRIDGSGLPLLTEEHLTGMLHMKLGPALKLQATLRRRLAACARAASPAPRADRQNGACVKSEPASHAGSPS